MNLQLVSRATFGARSTAERAAPILLLALTLSACDSGRAPVGNSAAAGQYQVEFRVNVSRPVGGTIRSVTNGSPDGKIDCGTKGGAADTCAEVSYPWSATATLAATPDDGFVFVGWAADCRGLGTCELNTAVTGADKWAAAAFEPAAIYKGVYFLVSVNRPVGGTITSDDGRIRCGTAPDANACGPVEYGWDATATLTAVADPGFMFLGWGSTSCPGIATACSLDTKTFATDKTLAVAFGGPLVWDLGYWDQGTWQ